MKCTNYCSALASAPSTAATITRPTAYFFAFSSPNEFFWSPNMYIPRLQSNTIQIGGQWNGISVPSMSFAGQITRIWSVSCVTVRLHTARQTRSLSRSSRLISAWTTHPDGTIIYRLTGKGYLVTIILQSSFKQVFLIKDYCIVSCEGKLWANMKEQHAHNTRHLFFVLSKNQH